MNTRDQIKADKKLIEKNGGPTKLAETLGYDKMKGGVQRVQNWRTRGIPPRVKVEFPDIFMVPVAAKVAPKRRRAARTPP